MDAVSFDTLSGTLQAITTEEAVCVCREAGVQDACIACLLQLATACCPLRQQLVTDIWVSVVRYAASCRALLPQASRGL